MKRCHLDNFYWLSWRVKLAEGLIPKEKERRERDSSDYDSTTSVLDTHLRMRLVLLYRADPEPSLVCREDRDETPWFSWLPSGATLDGIPRRLMTWTPISKSKILYLSESYILYPYRAVHALQPKCLFFNIHCSPPNLHIQFASLAVHDFPFVSSRRSAKVLCCK